jgi:phosphoglycerol transferase MdoB-like AlkP superfamily enzyme
MMIRRWSEMAKIMSPVWRPVLITLVALTLSRLAHSIWLSSRVSEAQAWTHVFVQGLRFDAVLLGLVWVIPAALTPWMALNQRLFHRWAQALRVYALAWFVAIMFMEMATPSFMHQYDARPNYMFVEYLGYVQEVGTTLVKGYWPQLLAAAITLPLLAWAHWRMTRAPAPDAAARLVLVVPLSLVLFAVFALAGRGALGHRPANPASAALTHDHLVNELPLSSAYTLMYAINLARKDGDGGIAYGTMPRQKVIEVVRREMGLRDQPVLYANAPTWHEHQSPHKVAKPYNLVIVLQESMGAEFVGKLGGLPLTPNLDALAKEGWWFENLYATGTRSVRGIEAVLAGFPPTSAVSTVRLPKSQRNFFTIASFLKTQGYESTFYYGGEAHFDNMRGFFMGNGFDRVMDKAFFPPNTFWATWGASDGDLFELAHQTFDKEHGTKPFFGLVFTSTNHAPFEFPDGKIELYEQPKQTANNAVKYADHAMGEFFKKAKRSKYWNDTIFLVVADHNSRVYGSSIIPIERFQIPGLILGGPIKEPLAIKTLASQIDLAPTLFGLLGLDWGEPLIGRNLANPAKRALPGHAIMQFDKVQAYMEGSQHGEQSNDVVVLQPGQAPRSMVYENKRLRDAQPDEAMIEKAVAHALFAKMAYSEQMHRQKP